MRVVVQVRMTLCVLELSTLVLVNVQLRSLPIFSPNLVVQHVPGVSSPVHDNQHSLMEFNSK